MTGWLPLHSGGRWESQDRSAGAGVGSSFSRGSCPGSAVSCRAVLLPGGISDFEVSAVPLAGEVLGSEHFFRHCPALPSLCPSQSIMQGFQAYVVLAAHRVPMSTTRGRPGLGKGRQWIWLLGQMWCCPRGTEMPLAKGLELLHTQLLPPGIVWLQQISVDGLA